MLRERCLDYLLGDRLLATVHLIPAGNVNADHSEDTLRVYYRHVFTGRRLVAVANEAKTLSFRRHTKDRTAAATGYPQVTFDDFKRALDAEARTIQSLLRRAEDLPEHVPSCVSREMVQRIKRIALAEIE